MIQFKPLDFLTIDTAVLMMQDFYSMNHYPIDTDVSKQLFETFIADKNLGRAWLIYHNNAVVGYVILIFIFSFEYQGKIAFLDELFLSEGARGKGIGKETIAFVKAESHNLSLKLLYLEVEPHNNKAQKLYLSTDL